MNLVIGQTYPATVVEILPFGAVVSLEDNSTELIHVSNIADCYITNISDFVGVGRTYLATACKGKKLDVELTLKPLHLKSSASKPSHQTNSRRDSRNYTKSFEGTSNRPNRSSNPHNRQKSSKSLDDMIAKSDTVFEDKFEHKLNLPPRNSRGSNKPRRR